MGVVFEGMGKLVAVLRKAPTAMDLATRAATSTAAHLIETQVKTELTRTTHKKGEPTPSRPGEPPALVSGHLRNSVRVQGPTRLGFGRYQASVEPTAIYSRVQELGGGPVPLPARPYVKPAMEELESSGKLAETYRTAWRAAWRGRG